jgi:hypothetical protein
MPARHREHHSTAHPKTFTITLERYSHPAGICVHDALETVNTIDRNMQVDGVHNIFIESPWHNSKVPNQ